MRDPVARGNMPYSAVTQPLPVPRIHDGTRSSKLAVQIIATVAGQLGIDIDPEDALADATREAGKKAEGDVFTDPLANDKMDVAGAN